MYPLQQLYRGQSIKAVVIHYESTQSFCVHQKDRDQVGGIIY